MKRKILSILLLAVMLMSVFSVSVFADDNATSGEGTTHKASDGFGWYNTNQCMWKVTLYVGKSDQATKQSSLTNDFYRVGTVVMKAESKIQDLTSSRTVGPCRHNSRRTPSSHTSKAFHRNRF